jgi:transcription-repair coupling factor (superfamily II helicase)
MYKKEKILNSTAMKRLEAIKEFTELGSGYKISMRDLAIRGAGDILGREQAGFIDSIGVNMYLDLINEEVNGINPDEEDNTNQVNIDVETHIGEEYSEDSDILIELHKKINSINTKEDLNNTLFEIRDRFGMTNLQLELYAHEKYLEKLISKTGVILLSNDNLKSVLKVKKEVYSNLSIEDLFYESTKISSKFNFTYKNDYILITLLKASLEKNYIYYLESLLEKIDELTYRGEK